MKNWKVLAGFALALVVTAGRAEGPDQSSREPKDSTFSPVFAYSSAMGFTAGGAYFHHPKEGGDAWNLMAMSTMRGRFLLDGNYRCELGGRWFCQLGLNHSQLPVSYAGEGMRTSREDRRDVENREDRARAGVGYRFGEGFSATLDALYRARRGELLPKTPLDRKLRDFAVSGALEWERRDFADDPRHGWFGRVECTVVPGGWTLNDKAGTLSQASADFRGYHTRGILTLAGRLVVERTLAGEPDYLFRKSLGGDNVLRGYATNRFRGKHLEAAQAEARVHVWKRVSLVAFMDVGSVTEDGFTTFRHTPGAGARFGLGPTGRVKLRVDYGKGRDESNLTVTFGHCF